MVSEAPLHNPCGGDLALDFVDSIGRDVGGPGIERLVDYAALLRWSEEAGSLPPPVARRLAQAARAHPRAAAAALRRARSLREALFETFLAEAQGSPPPAAARAGLEAELAVASARARLERGRAGWSWTWDWGDALDAPLWPVARAAADLLVSPDLAHVKVCASDTCLWLFVDRSRNQSRRWCEMSGCGNLAKVRRHRRRARGE